MVVVCVFSARLIETKCLNVVIISCPLYINLRVLSVTFRLASVACGTIIRRRIDLKFPRSTNDNLSTTILIFQPCQARAYMQILLGLWYAPLTG